jgi:hypothetical protein
MRRESNVPAEHAKDGVRHRSAISVAVAQVGQLLFTDSRWSIRSKSARTVVGNDRPTRVPQ